MSPQRDVNRADARGHGHSPRTALSERTALVTGGGRGIGRAIAVELARAGARPILVARSTSELRTTAELIQAEGGLLPKTLSADLAVETERSRVVEMIGRPVDVVVHCAGTIEPVGPAVALQPSDVRRALEVNLVAAVDLNARVLPAMLEAGWGRIIAVSSGIVAHPADLVGAGVYAATKAALEAYTLNLAAELTGSGVEASIYRPGNVDTAMQAWVRGQSAARIGRALHNRFRRNYAEGRLISAEQSATALLTHLLARGAGANGAIWDAGRAPTSSAHLLSNSVRAGFEAVLAHDREEDR